VRSAAVKCVQQPAYVAVETAVSRQRCPVNWCGVVVVPQGMPGVKAVVGVVQAGWTSVCAVGQVPWWWWLAVVRVPG